MNSPQIPVTTERGTSARVGHVAWAIRAREVVLPALMLGVSTLGVYLADEVLQAEGLVAEDELAALVGLGPRSIGTLSSRGNLPLQVQEDESGYTTTTLTVSALIPLPGGAMHVELSVIGSGEIAGEGLPFDTVMPLAAHVVWMAVGDVDSARIISCVRDWLESIELIVDEDDEEPLILPDVLLAETVDALHDRIAFRDGLIDQLNTSVQVKTVRAAAETHRRSERALTRHVDQLKTELETQRAVAKRQRDRADDAERRARSAIVNVVGSIQSATALAAPVDNEYAAECDRLQLVTRQQTEELDRLRAEVYRWREEATRRSSTPLQTATSTLSPGTSSQDTLQGLSSWVQANLGGRMVIHVKAARAARKSAFADPGLVYRTLQALADHYWPMRFLGDATSRDTWEAFLETEHLSCGPTGAAVYDRRTRSAYLVNWQHRQVELDQHLQGASSRDEARTFRVYFHVDTERQVIVVGHLPSHLPNSLT